LPQIPSIPSFLQKYIIIGTKYGSGQMFELFFNFKWVLSKTMKKILKSNDFVDAYSRFLPFVKPYIFLAILGILLTVPVGALDAAIAWFLKPFMDNVMVNKNDEFADLVPFIIVGFTVLQGSLITFLQLLMDM
jgi:hypothetical protein